LSMSNYPDLLLSDYPAILEIITTTEKEINSWHMT
jgi:hypothetical protein